jgi:hypothetical protein
LEDCRASIIAAGDASPALQASEHDFDAVSEPSVAKACDEFDEAGRMKPSAYYEMAELVKFTPLPRRNVEYLFDR